MPKLYRVRTPNLRFAGRPRDIRRAAVLGAALFGVAGAAVGAYYDFSAFEEAGPVAGATIEVGWRVWGLLSVVIGMAVGAAIGAMAALVAGTVSAARGSATAVVAVGTLGGLLAGALWGRVLAVERTMTVRAYAMPSPPPVGGVGEGFSVTTGNLQMIGKLNRRTNVPVLAFAVVAGTAIGVMAGRGMAGPWPEPETWAGAPEGSFPVMAVKHLATELSQGRTDSA